MMKIYICARQGMRESGKAYGGLCSLGVWKLSLSHSKVLKVLTARSDPFLERSRAEIYRMSELHLSPLVHPPSSISR